MPRRLREHSGTGIYHVMLRGINRHGASVRQIARVTGVAYGVVYRINAKR